MVGGWSLMELGFDDRTTALSLIRKTTVRRERDTLW